MLINNKRERSHSRSKSCESKSNKKQRIEENNRFLNKSTAVESSHKVNCAFCSRDISRTIRVICDKCEDLEYCVDCLVLCKENKYHHKHDYHIVDKLSLQIFTQEWTAAEELILLSSIEKFGLDNWTDISENMGTKAKLECEAHYYNFYYKDKEDYLPSDKDCILDKDLKIIASRLNENKEKEQKEIKKLSQNVGKVPEFTSNKESKNNRSRSLAKNRNRKDQTAITSASEVLGYWPKREEFDIEFLNDAELEIAELEFLDDDTNEEKELKMDVLKVYNAQLEEREKRKKFVIERNLLDIKRQMNFERKLSKDDREIFNCLKPFARFMENSQFFEMFEGIVLEKNLRQRLNQLKQYKKAGIKTYEEIEKFLEVESRKNKDDKKNQSVFDSCGLGGRINRYLKYGNEEYSELDSNEKEKNFIKNLCIPRSTYYDIKKRISKELLMDAEAKNIVSKFILPKIEIDRELAEEIVNFIISLNN